MLLTLSQPSRMPASVSKAWGPVGNLRRSPETCVFFTGEGNLGTLYSSSLLAASRRGARDGVAGVAISCARGIGFRRPRRSEGRLSQPSRPRASRTTCRSAVGLRRGRRARGSLIAIDQQRARARSPGSAAPQRVCPTRASEVRK